MSVSSAVHVREVYEGVCQVCLVGGVFECMNRARSHVRQLGEHYVKLMGCTKYTVYIRDQMCNYSWWNVCLGDEHQISSTQRLLMMFEAQTCASARICRKFSWVRRHASKAAACSPRRVSHGSCLPSGPPCPLHQTGWDLGTGRFVG